MRMSLLIALAASTLASCKKAPEAVAPDPAFWKWTTANLDALKAVKTGHEPITDLLSQQLENVAPGLVFELGIGRDPFELIISADGKDKLFPVVKRLVAAAPALPGTKVIAFRPRKDVEDFTMQMGVTKLSGKDLWFVATEDPERKGLLAVDLYVLGLKDENDDRMKNAAFTLLEAAVGEFDLETKIGAIDILPAPEKPAPPLKPLKELPAAVDTRK